MDGDFIVTAYVVLDKTMATLGHRDHVLAQASDAEVLTVAVVAAKCFQNHLERALQMMRLGRYLSGPLSISRFNRRLHRLADWLGLALETLGALFATGEAFLIDSMPVPVCRRARARRSRKLSGPDFCGYCAAKREKFFGWRLHLICTTEGVPAACDLVPPRSTSWPTGCRRGRRSTATRPTTRSTRRASPRTPRRASSPSARRTCAPTSGPTSWPCALGASASRVCIANWRRWACSASAPAPTLASNSSSTPRSWP
jgi:hypothetical protein